MSLVVHPYAAAFPMMSDDELDALADDIKANGLRHPIVVDKDGVLIDGRNRLAACERAGVEPRFETLPADLDPFDFIVGVNVERRHLSTGQRAMARAMALAAQGKRKGRRWARGDMGNLSHSEYGAWRKAMNQAGVVLDYVPECAALVLEGEADWTLASAYREAVRIRDQINKRVDRGTELRQYAPDLAERATAETFDQIWEEFRARKIHARNDAKRIATIADELAAAPRSLAVSCLEWRDLARTLDDVPNPIEQLRAAHAALADLADQLDLLMKEYGDA